MTLTVTGLFVFALPVKSLVISGAFGLVVSVAPFGADGSDTFPDASVAFAVTSPTGMLFATVIVATPSSPAVPVPISWLSLSYNFTVDPGSALTLTVTGLFVFALPVKSVVISGADGFLITFPFNLISGVGSLAPTPAPLCLYVTSPFAATCNSAVLTDGFAFFTASLTSSISFGVRFVRLITGTFSTGFNPANASVSYESTFPFLLLS